MFIWEALCGAYGIEGSFFGDDNKYSKLWSGDEDGTLGLKPWETNALRTTYDNAVVERGALPAIAASLREFHRAYRNDTKVCSLSAQANAIDDAYSKGARAVAWNQTSVNADCRWLGVRIDEDDYRPYNIDRDNDHTVHEWAPWPVGS